MEFSSQRRYTAHIFLMKTISELSINPLFLRASTIFATASFMADTIPLQIQKKVKVGSDQERRNKTEIPTPKTEVGKTRLTISYLYLENIS